MVDREERTVDREERTVDREETGWASNEMDG